MTNYERIKRELVTLGWKPSQGDGSHMKFNKDGVKETIVVSLNLDDMARAYQNSIAEIRRIEPDFTLDRPAKKKEDKKSADSPADGWPPHIRIGAKVRYTTPERKDWTQLDRPGSVMNIQYEVKDIQEDGRVLITSGTNGYSFTVSPDELSAWAVLQCPVCGRRVPADQIREKGVCADCKAAGSTAGERQELPEILDEKPLPYHEVPAGLLPVYIREGMNEMLQEKLKRVPKSKLTQKLKDSLDILSMEKKKTPAGAWKQFTNTFFVQLARRSGIDPRDKKEIFNLQARVNTIVYSQTKIGKWDVYTVSTPDYALLCDIWRYQWFFFEEFSTVSRQGGGELPHPQLHRQRLPAVDTAARKGRGRPEGDRALANTDGRAGVGVPEDEDGRVRSSLLRRDNPVLRGDNGPASEGQGRRERVRPCVGLLTMLRARPRMERRGPRQGGSPSTLRGYRGRHPSRREGLLRIDALDGEGALRGQPQIGHRLPPERTEGGMGRRTEA